MTLNDLLDVAGCVVNVKYGDHYVKSVDVGLDNYDYSTLEVEIE